MLECLGSVAFRAMACNSVGDVWDGWVPSIIEDDNDCTVVARDRVVRASLAGNAHISWSDDGVWGTEGESDLMLKLWASW